MSVVGGDVRVVVVVCVCGDGKGGALGVSALGIGSGMLTCGSLGVSGLGWMGFHVMGWQHVTGWHVFACAAWSWAGPGPCAAQRARVHRRVACCTHDTLCCAALRCAGGAVQAGDGVLPV